MNDELRAWLGQARAERDAAQVALQRGDQGPMAVWALRYGPVLLEKAEAFVEAVQDVPELLHEIAEVVRRGDAGESEEAPQP